MAPHRVDGSGQVARRVVFPDGNRSRKTDANG